MSILIWVLPLMVCVATAYQVISGLLVRRFARLSPPVPTGFPKVSLLKPLCGNEPALKDNLASFCRQDYPDFQIVFGVHSQYDPALAVADSLRAEFPALDIRIAIGSRPPETGNPKVANLVDMIPLADGEVFVIADSDMNVTPDYLQAVVATLQQPGVGLATCAYVSHSSGGLWSRLGAMGINFGFLPSVLVGQALGRTDGCFGATMALPRATLEKIGGIGRFADQIADDYQLGAAVRDLGLSIGLVPALPSTLAGESDAHALTSHEVRWGRTLASIDRMGYAGTVFTQAVPLGLLTLLVDGLRLHLPILGILTLAAALAGRVTSIHICETALGLDRQPVWMVMLRDVLTVLVQLVALSGRRVRWRGALYRIEAQGVLVSLEEGE